MSLQGNIAASGINFYESISIEKAKELAEKEGKNIFIDTYTDWCIPCKKMEKTFMNDDVADFYNLHFINVRINMDYSEYAPEYRKIFDVIFLPTLLILDKEGTIRFKADKILSASDLISLGKKSLNQNAYLPSMATEIVGSPMESKHRGSIKQEVRGPETIIHVMGKGTQNLPPDILRQEAYFRLEFMDGSHIKVAKDYLQTQQDWLTPTNMRFLIDFVPDTRSKEFAFIIANKDKFDKEIGSDQVNISIQMLVYLQLYQGYPRPNFEESKSLFKLVNKEKYNLLTYQYYMSRLQDECKMDEYLGIAEKYLLEINPADDYVMFVMADYLSEVEETKEKTLQWVQKAIKANPNEPDYHFLGAHILFGNGHFKKASTFIDNAIVLAVDQNRKHEHYLKLRDMISKSNKKM